MARIILAHYRNVRKFSDGRTRIVDDRLPET